MNDFHLFIRLTHVSEWRERWGFFFQWLSLLMIYRRIYWLWRSSQLQYSVMKYSFYAYKGKSYISSCIPKNITPAGISQYFFHSGLFNPVQYGFCMYTPYLDVRCISAWFSFFASIDFIRFCGQNVVISWMFCGK